MSAIFYADAEAIRRTCEFSTRQATMDTIYLRLNATTFVVRNSTNSQITCKGANSRPVSNSTCIPCVVTTGCSCVLKSAETRIPAPTNCEKSVQPTTVLHTAYNAAVLREFYGLANQSLKGDHLVPVAGLAPPAIKLTVFSSNVTQLLAADDTLSYSLRKVSDYFVNASSVLHSPTEAVLFQYLRQMATTETSFPNFNSLETWFVLAPLPCCALLLISSVFLHRRVQVLTMALAISTPRVQAFELKMPTPTIAPTTTVSPILQWIDTFRQHDLVLISLVIGIIVCMIIIATATHRALARRSFIYI
jgi:hypothetical protein